MFEFTCIHGANKPALDGLEAEPKAGQDSNVIGHFDEAAVTQVVEQVTC